MIYTETDNDDGTIDIELKCEESNRPFTRTNMYGMFCDEEDCICEKKSRELYKIFF